MIKTSESLEVMKCQSFLSFRHAVTTRWMTDSHLLQDQTGVCPGYYPHYNIATPLPRLLLLLLLLCLYSQKLSL